MEYLPTIAQARINYWNLRGLKFTHINGNQYIKTEKACLKFHQSTKNKDKAVPK